ncbi:hypothetical protein CONLIGDRAFT_299833 [Coniochaeta ligniaria NRRL 30616]|uniref:Uncharacterized protein n=1 Tax=Coniochaeta ligniaria NRRL 30616 TaxID=1408157 RepID=A0A1J7JP42_9PEZI|nr:hypothetical protein CONLIGDRAFT_299833 [Coniochaeta ligniaria NRRL 30616]
MSAPRTKRQFAGAASDPNQRQIQEFFKPSPSGINSQSDLTSGPLSPPLPGPVQANLISVGMRVRKSVPEGYKTGHKFGTFSLWADTSAPSHHSPSDTFQLSSNPTPDGSAPSPRRELLPFCGINKVGGMAVQPESLPIPASFFTSSALDKPAISISPVPELDDLPGLTSSQDSVLSTTSSPPSFFPPQQYPSSSSSLSNRNTKKRTYADDASTTLCLPDANGTIIWRQRRELLDGEVSPHSLRPAEWEKNARVMAVPRGVRKGGAVAQDGGGAARLGGLDQENRVAVVAGGGDDFEEAEFLDYMEVEDE